MNRRLADAVRHIEHFTPKDVIDAHVQVLAAYRFLCDVSFTEEIPHDVIDCARKIRDDLVPLLDVCERLAMEQACKPAVRL